MNQNHSVIFLNIFIIFFIIVFNINHSVMKNEWWNAVLKIKLDFNIPVIRYSQTHSYLITILKNKENPNRDGGLDTWF